MKRKKPPRLFIVRGSRPPVLGREIERKGHRVVLNIAPRGRHHLIACEFDRSQLVFAGGPEEE